MAALGHSKLGHDVAGENSDRRALLLEDIKSKECCFGGMLILRRIVGNVMYLRGQVKRL